jgi:3-dehydrosphinganine reductase
MEWLSGKKVVITGGSSGIGKATAILCAKAGADVCILARDPAKLETAQKEIRAAAGAVEQKVVTIAVDVSDRSRIMAAAPDIVKQLDGIDILVNSAGITWPGYVHEIPDSVWDSIIQVDYMGTVNAVRAFLPFFMKQKQGNIANIASAAGYIGIFGYAAYTPAKFAVAGFSECLRQDLLPYNVTVSVIYPADVDTPQWHEENKIKPPETRAVAGNVKVTSPEIIATALLKGIERGKFTIVPGGMNKLTYFLSRHAPWIVWKIVSGQLRGYWKKNPAK